MEKNTEIESLRSLAKQAHYVIEKFIELTSLGYYEEMCKKFPDIMNAFKSEAQGTIA